MAHKYATVNSRLGWVGIVGSENGLTAVTLPVPSREDALAELMDEIKNAKEDVSAFGDLPQRLQRYFEAERIDFSDKLDFGNATPFQKSVWTAAQSIPYGETRSYSWLADKIGKKAAARAVGNALSQNPIPIIVPCHRIIGAAGDLCGFGGGLGMKKHLLDIEARGSKGAP